MNAAAFALLAAYGTHLCFTALALGWRGIGPAPRRSGWRRPSFATWLAQAGLDDVRPVEFVVASAIAASVAGLLALALVGAPAPSLAIAAATGCVPAVSYRSRRRRLREQAREAWPRMVEEIRIATGALGRSVPAALFEVGRGAPPELRPAFDAARREWLVSTDFDRSTQVLKDRLADPTADAVCETLLVAHELGSGDLDSRLRALADDRAEDVRARRDARARQAGVRFARRFVLIVPAGMGIAGMSVGPGRSAYATAQGQVAVLLALAVVACCWVWAGRLLRLPDQERVFP